MYTTNQYRFPPRKICGELGKSLHSGSEPRGRTRVRARTRSRAASLSMRAGGSHVKRDWQGARNTCWTGSPQTHMLAARRPAML